jgi:hypothetical protein
MVFIDETAVSTNMRPNGRSACGERLIGYVPLAQWDTHDIRCGPASYRDSSAEGAPSQSRGANHRGCFPTHQVVHSNPPYRRMYGVLVEGPPFKMSIVGSLPVSPRGGRIMHFREEPVTPVYRHWMCEQVGCNGGLLSIGEGITRLSTRWKPLSSQSRKSLSPSRCRRAG